MAAAPHIPSFSGMGIDPGSGETFSHVPAGASWAHAPTVLGTASSPATASWSPPASSCAVWVAPPPQLALASHHTNPTTNLPWHFRTTTFPGDMSMDGGSGHGRPAKLPGPDFPAILPTRPGGGTGWG